MTDPEPKSADQVHQQLADAGEARREHGRLLERLQQLDGQFTETDAGVVAARSKLADETADVAKLDSFSATRILVALKGDRIQRLEQEKAEQQAAEYAVATAEHRRLEVLAERDAVRTRLAGLGDVEARWEAALVAKGEWLSGADPESGQRITELATRTGELRDEARELDEAIQAHAVATRELGAAAGFLDSAESWSTYDTFFGGGMLADIQKHDKLDQATNMMRSADRALRRLAKELADVRIEAVGGVDIDGTTRTFDIWFDNIFSDYAVRQRIQECIARVESARNALVAVGHQLQQRRVSVADEMGQTIARREDLLRG